jgi:hypothetical protein
MSDEKYRKDFYEIKGIKDKRLEELDRKQKELMQNRINFQSGEPLPVKDKVAPIVKEIEEKKLAGKIAKEAPEYHPEGKSFFDKIKAMTKQGPEKTLDMDEIKKETKKIAKKIPNWKKGLKSVAGGVPYFGALMGALSALNSGDVSAAVPVLNDVDDLGPAKGSLEAKLESGEPLTPEEKLELLRKSQNNN